MKRITHKTWTILFAFLMFSLNFSSCEQEDLNFYIDCDYCLDSIPLFDTLYVSVTINEENPFVPLVFYIGDTEEGNEDRIDTASHENFWLVSEVGVKYSVKATYKKGDETVFAIDGDKISVVDGEGECYPPCYYVRGGTLDVRLK
ncbi:MAG: hypothetical protein K9J30_03215 [Bacteroidales bacterium]|nr:hypothetical protein [Bacteroidales bacterium]